MRQGGSDSAGLLFSEGATVFECGTRATRSGYKRESGRGRRRVFTSRSRRGDRFPALAADADLRW